MRLQLLDDPENEINQVKDNFRRRFESGRAHGKVFAYVVIAVLIGVLGSMIYMLATATGG